MSKKILLLILFLAPSISYSNICGSLFTTESIKSSLETVLLNESVIGQITEIRRKYEGMDARSKMGATVQFLTILEKGLDFSHKNISEVERKVLEIGIDNLLVDLAQISPRYIQTERIMNERIAFIMGMLAAEKFKSTAVSKYENVISISEKKFQDNSEYLNAQRILYSLIDFYQSQDYIPRVVLVERVEELIRTDLRVQALDNMELYELTNQIVSEFNIHTGSGVERILEKYFTSRNKARTL